METQARKLAGLIESISYYFGTQNMDGECCEGISHGEFRALRAAKHIDRCSMQDIAKSAVVTKSGATRIISRLEEKGLAAREQDPKDGRVCCVRLTERGRSLLDRIEDKLFKRMKTILAELDPAMRDILILSLGAFFKAAQGEITKPEKIRLVN